MTAFEAAQEHTREEGEDQQRDEHGREPEPGVAGEVVLHADDRAYPTDV